MDNKIPTNIATVNLIKQSTAEKGLRLPAGSQPMVDNSYMLTDWIKIEPSTVYTLSTYENVNEADMYYSLSWYSTNNSDYSGWISRPTGTATAADLKKGRQYTSPANATYAKVSYPIKYPKVKLERGNIASDYNAAPEDIYYLLAQKQDTIKSNTSIAITANTLRQLYYAREVYTVTNARLMTYRKSLSQNTTPEVNNTEFNFTLKINQGQQSATFTLTDQDKDKFGDIITTYGTGNAVRINGCLFTLTDATLTVSTDGNAGSNLVITFSDII